MTELQLLRLSVGYKTILIGCAKSINSVTSSFKQMICSVKMLSVAVQSPYLSAGDEVLHSDGLEVHIHPQRDLHVLPAKKQALSPDFVVSGYV